MRPPGPERGSAPPRLPGRIYGPGPLTLEWLETIRLMMRQYELVERVQKYDPTADEALLNRAYVYAMRALGNQKRASGDPYFSHPLEVAAILTDLRLDDATIATALLHDVIEDTDATRAEIDQPSAPRSARSSMVSPRSSVSISSRSRPSRPNLPQASARDFE